MNAGTVNDVAGRYGIDLEGVGVTLRKDIMGGYRGEALPNGSIELTRSAFASEEHLAKTLFEERFHVGQIVQRGYPTTPGEVQAYENEAHAALHEWWSGLG
jgi:hypothetical protein